MTALRSATTLPANNVVLWLRAAVGAEDGEVGVSLRLASVDTGHMPWERHFAIMLLAKRRR